MKWNKRALMALLCLSLVPALWGCQLARTDQSDIPGEDRLVGCWAVFGDEREAARNGEISFTDPDAPIMYLTWVPLEGLESEYYIRSSNNDGYIQDMGIAINNTDDRVSYSLTGSVYVTRSAHPNFSLINIYERADGTRYADTSDQTSSIGMAWSRGTKSTLTVERTFRSTIDGKTKQSESMTLIMDRVCIDTLKSVKVIELSANYGVLRETDVPAREEFTLDTLTDTQTVLVEETCVDEAGKTYPVVKFYTAADASDYDGEMIAYHSCCYPDERGIARGYPLKIVF